MLGKGVARLLVVTLVAFGTWSPFLCDFGFVFGGCVMLVASFNMFVVGFKHVSYECVEELFIAGRSSLVMHT